MIDRMGGHCAPDAETLRRVLCRVKRIAIVGAKDKPGQPVDRVGRYLIGAGYAVIPVHPKRARVWGLPAYAALGDIPEAVDLVLLFRASEFCLDHAREVLALPWRPLLFWMQLGIENAEARRLLAEQGGDVVENSCLMVEHARLFGGSVFR